MSFDFELWAIQSYNRLRLIQPQVEEAGLYKVGDTYQIVCPTLDAATKAVDGTPLVTWFDRQARPILTPVSLARSVPVGGVRVRELTGVETASCTGVTRTLRDIYADLALELPPDFPSYYIQDSPGVVTVVVARGLSTEEDQRLRETLDRLKLSVSWSISVAASAMKNADEFERLPQGDIDLLPARSARLRGWSADLCKAIRRDEEAWLEHRGQLSRLSSRAQILEGTFSVATARCLINAAAFPTDDIRNYLSIYQKVAIIAPLESATDQFFRTANFAEDELVELTRMGRVEIVCPQPADRYPVRLLEKLAEAAPGSLLLSRRLALATAADGRRRVPLLYPDLPMKGRAELLRGLLKGASRMKDPRHGSIMEAFVRDIGRTWNDAEELLHRRGAMANAALGISLPMTKMFEAAGLPSRDIELMSAAMAVEWAGALAASVQPVEARGYSERPYTEVLSRMYTGLKMDEAPRCLPAANVEVQEILAVGREVPVLDFAKSFTGGDIDKLRDCIHGLSMHKYERAETEERVRAFNKEVARYAGDAERIERWDLAGLVLWAAGTLPAAAAGAKGIAAASGTVSLGIWILARVKRLVDEGVITSPEIVAWADATAAKLLSTTPEAILVQRLRQRLGKARK